MPFSFKLLKIFTLFNGHFKVNPGSTAQARINAAQIGILIPAILSNPI